MFTKRLKQRKLVNLLLVLVLNTLVLLSVSWVEAAEDYPTGPISVVVGSRPGGAAGISATLFAGTAKKYLPKSQPIVVVYKPGGAGAIGAEYMLKKPKNGHTLFWSSPDLVVKLAKEGPKLHYTKEDFFLLGCFATNVHTVMVQRDGPFKTLEDYITYAKEHPGKVTYSTSGVGGIMHLTSLIFQKQTGIKLHLIPFKGGAAAMAGLMGGHVDSYFGTPATAGDNIKPEGKLRALALFSSESHPNFPKVRTIVEEGYKIDRRSWYFAAAPAGTPQATLAVLQKVFRDVAGDSQVKEGLIRSNYFPVYWDHQAVTKRANEEFELAKEFFGESASK